MEKIDLTLENIFAGDIDRRLLSQEVRDYKRSIQADSIPLLYDDLPSVNIQIAFGGMVYMKEDSHALSTSNKNIERNEIAENIEYFMNKVFGLFYGWRSPYIKFTNSDDESHCHRCGISVHLLNYIYSLCTKCHHILEEMQLERIS